MREQRRANLNGRKGEAAQYRTKHGEEIRLRDRSRYVANPEPKKKSHRKYYQKDPASHVKRVSKWVKENPEKARENYLKYQHTKGRFKRTGHSKEYYEARWNEQGGCCAICGKPFTDTGSTRPVADHNHVTGNPRAVLCVVCNGGLGWLEHPLMKKMLDYLDKWAAKHTEDSRDEGLVRLQCV